MRRADTRNAPSARMLAKLASAQDEGTAGKIAIGLRHATGRKQQIRKYQNPRRGNAEMSQAKESTCKLGSNAAMPRAKEPTYNLGWRVVWAHLLFHDCMSACCRASEAMIGDSLHAPAMPLRHPGTGPQAAWSAYIVPAPSCGTVKKWPGWVCGCLGRGAERQCQQLCSPQCRKKSKNWAFWSGLALRRRELAQQKKKEQHVTRIPSTPKTAYQ